MNINKQILVSSFVAIAYLVSAPKVLASGAYGSNIIVEPTEVHTTVDAGLADSLPQVATALVALSGLISTSVLLHKTK